MAKNAIFTRLTQLVNEGRVEKREQKVEGKRHKIKGYRKKEKVLVLSTKFDFFSFFCYNLDVWSIMLVKHTL